MCWKAWPAAWIQPGCPVYSEQALAQELDLFKTWYLDLHRKRPLRNVARWPFGKRFAAC